MFSFFKSISIFSKKPYRTGIALGGGGARGFAHLGVLQALFEREVTIDYISGTSAGAIVGVFIASGKTPIEVMQLMYDHKLFDFTSIILPKKGFLKLDKLEGFLKKSLPTDSFEDLTTPLTVTLSNLNQGKVEYHSSGSLSKKVIASASIPILFEPVEIEGVSYVDGGLFDNLPISPLQDVCEKIIGIDINPVQQIRDIDTITQVAARTFQLNDKSNTKKNAKRCDLFIQPQELNHYDLLDTTNAKKLFEIGYQHALNLDLTTLLKR